MVDHQHPARSILPVVTKVVKEAVDLQRSQAVEKEEAWSCKL